MSKKSHHFLTLWPWPLTYDLEKLIRSVHYHYQCVYQIWEQSIPWFLSYCVNIIAGGGRLWRKTITSPDPLDTGDITNSSFVYHQWIQIGDTVRKRSIWFKIGNFLSRVTLKFDGRPWKTIGLLFYVTSSFVHHFVAIGEFKLELQSGNAQSGSNSTIFKAVRPWNLTDDLAKQ